MLSGSYTAEQKELQICIPELEDEIDALKSTTNTEKNYSSGKEICTYHGADT